LFVAWRCKGALSCVSLAVKFESILGEFTSLIVAAFSGISVEYTQRISSLSAVQFMVEKSDLM